MNEHIRMEITLTCGLLFSRSLEAICNRFSVKEDCCMASTLCRHAHVLILSIHANWFGLSLYRHLKTKTSVRNLRCLWDQTYQHGQYDDIYSIPNCQPETADAVVAHMNASAKVHSAKNAYMFSRRSDGHISSNGSQRLSGKSSPAGEQTISLNGSSRPLDQWEVSTATCLVTWAGDVTNNGPWGVERGPQTARRGRARGAEPKVYCLTKSSRVYAGDRHTHEWVGRTVRFREVGEHPIPKVDIPNSGAIKRSPALVEFMPISSYSVCPTSSSSGAAVIYRPPSPKKSVAGLSCLQLSVPARHNGQSPPTRTALESSPTPPVLIDMRTGWMGEGRSADGTVLSQFPQKTSGAQNQFSLRKPHPALFSFFFFFVLQTFEIAQS
ncbi:hypothetical protein CEXT_279881 [Caerostris extrusa]|uniref:Uncharacterized protein n=1 Tax=Caerostris extrusa TaxID=172846 RepID=A0AAV4XRB9_CAEEX|nr:hypothetical protein CEXT_279881 [Caerostris extrusa]